MESKLFIAITSLTIGFTFNWILEFIRSNRNYKKEEHRQLLQKRIDFVEKQLSVFYWPIYLRLQKNNAIWKLILERNSDDPIKKELAYQIDRKISLSNHRQIMNIIESNLHLAQCGKDLENEIINYVRHIAIYDALREGNITDVDPSYLGDNWPKDFFPKIETKLRQLQSEYDVLVNKERKI